ncbi:type IV secretion system protein TraC [Novosphingobium subterraneum]|uniref:ATPase n=1 Tax=Novosphingobium subterraneum TaxID=48936 RepID=A0A0B8Z7L9_9SPHN|nr:type IV secretion system protein TraC [Novosphingobium subterraneum]KHS42211.1 ATPase [Novosphingobium subterraneum]
MSTSAWNRFLDLVFGEGARADVAPQSTGMPMLSDWLPYRSYDPETRLFINTASMGFILELAPMVGADERTGEIFTQFLSDGLPAGCEVQIIHWQSPAAGVRIADWVMPRVLAKGVYGRAAQHRAHYLRRAAWTSLSRDAPFCLRQHRVLVSIGASLGSSLTAKDLASVRESLGGTLQALSIPYRDIAPAELIAFLNDLLVPGIDNAESADLYSPLDPIHQQCLRRDLITEISPDRIVLKVSRDGRNGQASGPASGHTLQPTSEPEAFDWRFFSVRQMPRQWAPWDVQKLIGDVLNDKLRFGCNVLTVLGFVLSDEEATASRAGFKVLRTTSLADSRSARFLPQLAQQRDEWQQVQAELREGRKLVQACYSVGALSPLGKGDANERLLKSVYKAAGWDLVEERYLQTMALLAAMPLTLPNGLSGDLRRMKRLRTMLSNTAAAIAPLQGEHVGGPIPHMLLVGRRGQPFFWSPFQNAAGNHNVAVFGKSGSGKSVFLQDVCAALAGAGAKVIVIDDGRSFEHMAKAFGGAFVEFRLSSGFSLNPFDMIDAQALESDADGEDYEVECLAMLKSIVGQMARQQDRLSDTERGLIDSAVSRVWSEHKRAGTIDAIAAALRAMPSPSASDLADAMAPFLSGGTYGRFFAGSCSIDLTADLTVFELSDLSSKPELRSVALTALMFLTLRVMRDLDRSVPKLTMIDEAWQLLGGGQMGQAIETYARTCRKYGGALVTATQSLNDFYKSEGSLAALENSDWSVVLQQKEETVSDLARHQRFEMDRHTEALIRSLKRNGTEYSDVLIKGPETLAVGRLVLDPYSATLYSSSPKVFSAIETLVGRGVPLADAIEQVAFPDCAEPAIAAETGA